MDTMRERFARVATELLDADPRLAVVLADISADMFCRGASAGIPTGSSTSGSGNSC